MSMWLYITKGYGSQFAYKWCLKLEKKATNNKNKAFWELLTDLSKAFDFLSDDILIANFHANGLDLLFRA